MAISEWQEIDSDGSPMRLRVSRPEGAGPFPALVIAQHQGGVDEFIQSMTVRLADAGFAAAAPELYHRDGPDCGDDPRTRSMRLRDHGVIADLTAASRFLAAQNFVDASRIGIIGFCMGGRVVYLMAAADPIHRAAVAYYPGNTMRPWGRDVPSPFERSPEIHCPLLGHFGADDKNPSPDDMRKLDAELTRLGKAHEFHLYENAGHAFMDHTKESYRPQAEAASWPRTLDFLDRYLKK